MEPHIDLLFYHLKLRCYIICEIKGQEFDSRDAGQMSAYLSAVFLLFLQSFCRHLQLTLLLGLQFCHKGLAELFVYGSDCQIGQFQQCLNDCC